MKKATTLPDELARLLLLETDEIVTAYFAVELGNVIERDTAPDQKTEIFYFTKSLLGIFSRADFDQTCLVGRIQVTGSFGASSDYRPCGIVCHVVDESVLMNFPPVPRNPESGYSFSEKRQ